MKKTLKGFIIDYGNRPKKSLGQVFLIERSIQIKILELAELGPEDAVVEVGPGPGALTRDLARQVRHLVALEVDPALASYLRTSLPEAQNLHLVCIDALRFDYRRAASRLGTRLKLVANLPYGIAAPLLFTFLEQQEAFSVLVLMIQKEVAQRLAAPPCTKQYGVLTVLCRSWFDLRLERWVSRRCFFPVPKVDSAIVRLVPLRPPPIHPSEGKLFRQLVRAAFSKRRKTLLNALRSSSLAAKLPPGPDLADLLRQSGVDPSRRPETLTEEDYLRLYRNLRDNLSRR